jgi:hypothetical protein
MPLFQYGPAEIEYLIRCDKKLGRAREIQYEGNGV